MPCTARARRHFLDDLEGMTLTPNQTTETETAAELQPAETTALEPTPHDHAEHDHSHDHDHQHEPQATLNPELMREISVEVDADTVSKSFRKVVKKYQKLARIPGFRVGKVPESVIKSRFAKEVRQEVLEELVSDKFRQAIDEQKLAPVSQPQLTNLMLADGAPLQFKAAFEIKPDIDVTGYDAVLVTKPEVTLADAEYSAELQRVLEQHGTVEPVEEDRALVDGDWAEIEFKGEVQELAQVVGEETDTPTQEPITGDDVLIEVGGANMVDSVRTARGRLRYSVAMFGFMVALLEQLGVRVVLERTALGRPPVGEGFSWLAPVLVQLRWRLSQWGFRARRELRLRLSG